MMTGVLSYHMIEAAQALFDRSPSQLSAEERAEVERRARKSFDLQSLVLASPYGEGVSVPDYSLDTAMAVVEKRYNNHEEFLSDIALNGLNMDSLREALQRELWAEAVLERVAGQAPPVTPREIEEAYQGNKAKFHLPETRTARHILITENPDFPENTREAAISRLTAISADLGAHPSPEDFAGAASRNSECPSALNGGSLGRVPRGKLFPQLEQALFDLPQGEISAVVESEAGFHLVYCETVHPAGLMPLEEAAPSLKEALTKRRGERAKKLWLASLLESRRKKKRGNE